MLSAAAIALGVTALLAGFTGSWSPCGLSSIETIGSGLGRDPSRTTRALSLSLFSVFCLIGGAATFGGVSLLGSALKLNVDQPFVAIAAAGFALLAGGADLRFLPVVPQIRNQVPERIRHRLPLPGTSALYGLMLGLGFTTYLLTWAMWALLAGCFLIATPWLGLIVGVAFGAGRALPVLVLAGRYDRPSTQQFILDMETGPLLRGLRRIDGVALIACALLIIPVATAGAARLPGFAADPSADDAAGTVFNKHGGAGYMLQPNGAVFALPGNDPAIGGGMIAWHVGDQVTVANAFSLAPVASFNYPGVNALATDGQTLAFRATSAGRDTIHKLTIKGGAETALVTEFHPATLSPPAISDGTIVYSIWGKFSTQIEAISPSGSTRIVRKDGPWKVVSNPSISGDSLAYVRSRYCDQTLMTGKLSGRTNGRGDRVKLRIRSTAARDPGYERHYTHHFNAASKCHRRKFAKYHGTLWTTGLTPSRAMVTLLGHNRARPHVVTINR